VVEVVSMDSIETWSRFFAWCTVLNLGIYLISAVAVLTMRPLLVRVCIRWFGVAEDVLLRVSLQWLAAYKLGILLFALVPWLALTVMA
jgi:hypothetical protein